MTRTTVLGLALFATVTAVAVAVFPYAKLAETPKSNSANSAAAKVQRELAVELQRRFHDPNNLDFGISRVYMSGARRHATILQNKNMPLEVRQLVVRNQANSKQQPPAPVLKQSTMVVYGKLKQSDELFVAENAAEEAILEKAKKQKLQISVFTAGNFRNGKFNRVKGPAFVQRPSSESLNSEQIATWATSQYATDAKSYSGTVDGWQLYAERVFGTEDRCITCHGGIAPAPEDSYVAPKRGDSLGLFVIAVRNR